MDIPAEAQKYKVMDETRLTYVDDLEKLKYLAEHLSKQTEIAVDLEHHDHRTFLGITCLMQISSRDEDFIVDTIALKKHIGDALRGIFDDPKIVKVLHGANSDVEWLQRDFGLYVVNLFDTYWAARTLGLP